MQAPVPLFQGEWTGHVGTFPNLPGGGDGGCRHGSHLFQGEGMEGTGTILALPREGMEEAGTLPILLGVGAGDEAHSHF
jgi:hypothetical protein